jgi:tetratricopeptide (TPR) repeat protein/class 3 adenylate cyclase
VAAGPVRRFLVGDPEVQNIDVLAGSPLDRVAAAEGQAGKGEVVVAPEVAARLGDRLRVAEYRAEAGTGARFAVVAGRAESAPPAPWPTPEPELSDEQTRAWLLPPVYERLKGGQGGFLAEIRPAVALFLGFSGIDYDGDDLAGEKLDGYIRWVQRVLARYDGSLLQLTIGDKGSYLYAAFGAPVAHGDDPTQAVAAALELQAPPAELDFVGPVRIGVSLGRMRAGAYGGRTRRTYGVLGYEVVIAARLMGVAERGGIIVSQRVAQAVAADYVLESLGLIQVKGREEPMPVSRVLGRRDGVRGPAVTFPNPLVGRDAELAHMVRVLAAGAEGEGQILRLVGAAGIGKSHLVAEFSERAAGQGWRVAVGACQSTSRDIPYYAWRGVFRGLFELGDESPEDEDPAALTTRQIDGVRAIVKGVDPDWEVRLPLLGDLLDLPIPDNPTTAAFDPQLRQEALFTLAIDLLQGWALAQPTLILLEDVHWMDEASRGLTLALARVIARAPMALILVHRPPLDERQPILPELDDLATYHVLDLDDLSPEGVAAVISGRLSGAASPLLLDLIQLQARGNPFFVEELTDTLRELGHAARLADGTWTLSEEVMAALGEAGCLRRDRAGRWSLDPDVPLTAADLGLPDSIHGLVLARLDRLLEGHKLTIKVASVIGRIFQFQILARSHPVETDEAVLLRQAEDIERREFIRLETPPPQQAHIFRHNITRDVAYQSLLERQQRELHRAVAEALEGTLPDAVEQLAYHFSRARVRDKTLFYLDKAARKAQRDYANQTALNYYGQALALEENWEWRRGQIQVLHTLGRREEERASLERLAEDPDAPDCDTAYLRGVYFQALGDYAQAGAEAKRAMVIYRDKGDLSGEARCLAQLGSIARRQGEYEVAKAWYGEALALFQEDQRYPTEAMEAFADASNGLSNVYLQQGEYPRAQAAFERALALSRRSDNQYGEATALNNLGGSAYYYQRDLTEAVGRYQEGLEIRRTIGDRTGEGQSLTNLANTMRDRGDYGQAQDYLLEALVIQQATGNRWDEVNVWNDLGILYHQLGDLTQARTCLEEGLKLAQDIGDEAGQAYVLSNLGLVARDRGDLGTAEKLLADGLVIAERQSAKYLISTFLSYLGVVLLRAGRVGEAISQANRALTLRRDTNLPLLTADDLATLAAAYLALGDVPQALGYAQEAMTVLDESGGQGPEFPLQDYLFCHQVFAAAGQEAPAAASLQTAYAMVMSRAEKITDPDLRRSFLERVEVNREIVRLAQMRHPGQ